jgi:16S rRNA (cytidine1402-2'-O)-methyltransferase
VKPPAHTGTLYLLPSPLGEGALLAPLPGPLKNILDAVRHYIAEDEKSARRFVKLTGLAAPQNELQFFILNEHTPERDIPDFLTPLKEGKNMGLLSEAGCPGIADPGAAVVKLAHENGIRTVPVPGPSSIFLALMGSGMNGQQFSFHGYLPKGKTERIRKIKELETESGKKRITQIFIETPYRNKHLVEDVVANCLSDTLFCIAASLTLSGEYIETRPVSQWKGAVPDLDKKPAVFLLSRASL